MERQETGRVGEDLAAEYLRSRGWIILDRNWRCPAGELDIVACQPGFARTVVFCEVKTRRGLRFGQPIEAITSAKMAKLRDLGLLWLRARRMSAAHLRFDGIGVLLTPSGAPRFDHRVGIGA